MNTMLRWSPTRKFHFHHDVDDLFLRFFDGVTDETVQRPASWLPPAEGPGPLSLRPLFRRHREPLRPRQPGSFRRAAIA